MVGYLEFWWWGTKESETSETVRRRLLTTRRNTIRAWSAKTKVLGLGRREGHTRNAQVAAQ